MSSLSWCPLSEQFKTPFLNPHPVKSTPFPGRAPEAESTLCKDKIAAIYKQYGARGVIKTIGYDISHEIAEYLIATTSHTRPAPSANTIDITKDDLIILAIVVLSIFVLFK